MSLELWAIITVSIQVAALATVLVMALSIALALFMVNKSSKWLRLLELLIYMPMAMPPVALGYALLLIFGPNSFIAQTFKLEIAFTMAGAVLAAVCVSLGIGLRSMRLALLQIDPIHQQRAALMGGNAWQVFRFITWPQLIPAVISAAILVFIRALGEFGATMVIAGNHLGKSRTLALAIWTDMQMPGKENECLVLVMACALISLAALFIAEWVGARSRQ